MSHSNHHSYYGYHIAPQNLMGDVAQWMAWAKNIQAQLTHRTKVDLDQAIINKTYQTLDLMMLSKLGWNIEVVNPTTLARPNFSAYVYAGNDIARYTSNYESGAKRNTTDVEMRVYLEKDSDGTHAYLTFPVVDMPHIDPEQYIADILERDGVAEGYNYIVDKNGQAIVPFDVSANEHSKRKVAWERLRDDTGSRRDPDFVIPLLDLSKFCQRLLPKVYDSKEQLMNVQQHTPPSWDVRVSNIGHFINRRAGSKAHITQPPPEVLDWAAAPHIRKEQLRALLSEQYSMDVMLGGLDAIEAHRQHQALQAQVGGLGHTASSRPSSKL